MFHFHLLSHPLIRRFFVHAHLLHLDPTRNDASVKVEVNKRESPLLGMLSSLSPPVGDIVVASTRSRSLLLPLPSAAATRFLIPLAVWACLSVAVTASQTLPYIPTSIFLPAPKPGVTAADNATGNTAYIFSPRGNSADLLSLDISATLAASSLDLNTISSGLPFLKSDSTAFIPSLADNGSLLVYAGDCSGSKGSTIWSYNPANSAAGSTAWNQESIKHRPRLSRRQLQLLDYARARDIACRYLRLRRHVPG